MTEEEELARVVEVYLTWTLESLRREIDSRGRCWDLEDTMMDLCLRLAYHDTGLGSAVILMKED